MNKNSINVWYGKYQGELVTCADVFTTYLEV